MSLHLSNTSCLPRRLSLLVPCSEETLTEPSNRGSHYMGAQQSAKREVRSRQPTIRDRQIVRHTDRRVPNQGWPLVVNTYFCLWNQSSVLLFRLSIWTVTLSTTRWMLRKVYPKEEMYSQLLAIVKIRLLLPIGRLFVTLNGSYLVRYRGGISF